VEITGAVNPRQNPNKLLITTKLQNSGAKALATAHINYPAAPHITGLFLPILSAILPTAIAPIAQKVNTPEPNQFNSKSVKFHSFYIIGTVKPTTSNSAPSDNQSKAPHINSIIYYLPSLIFSSSILSKSIYFLLSPYGSWASYYSIFIIF